MAGDWIKMRKSLLTDPRIVRIMSACGADRLRTLGGFFSAMCLFDEQTEDGALDGYTPAILDEFIGFPGFTDQMIAVGWLAQTPQGLVAVDFTNHNGASAKRRAMESVRKMSARNADKCPQDEGTKSGTREEKRKEEKININTRGEKKKRTKPKPERPVYTKEESVGIYTCSNGETWTLTRQHVAELRAEFPAINIAAEAKDAKGWIEEEPHTRRKTYEGMPRFLSNWMKRADPRKQVPIEPPRKMITPIPRNV